MAIVRPVLTYAQTEMLFVRRVLTHLRTKNMFTTCFNIFTKQMLVLGRVLRHWQK